MKTFAPSAGSRLALVAVITTAGWCLFTAHRAASRPECAYFQASSCTAHALIKSDPYCAIDPTCISPFATTEWSNSGEVTWQGLAVLGDPLLVNGDPITLLAWPNYIAFAGLAIGIVVVACALGIGRDRRREIIVTVATFSALEIARWIYSVWKIVQLFYGIVFFLNPITYIVISVMILPLALCFNRAWRRS